MDATLTALLPVFFGLAVGYAAGRFRIVDNTHVDALNAVVMRIALPVALFSILASSKRADVVEHGALALAIFAVLVVMYAMVLVGRRAAPGTGLAEASVLALTVAFPNAAAVALPIAESVLGPTGQLAVAITLAIGSVTLTPVTLVLLARTAPDGATPSPRAGTGSVVLQSLANPLVFAPVAGLVWSVSGLPFPDLVRTTLGEVGSITAGLALFVTGLVLSAQSLRPTWVVLVLTLTGNVIRPALGVLAAISLHLSAQMTAETILVLAAPSGFFGVLLGLSRGMTSEIAGRTLFFSTLLSIVTLPLTIALLPSP